MKIEDISLGYECSTQEYKYPIKITVGGDAPKIMSIDAVIDRCYEVTRRRRGGTMIVLKGNYESIPFEELFNFLARIIYERRYNWTVLIDLESSDKSFYSDTQLNTLVAFDNVYII